MNDPISEAAERLLPLAGPYEPDAVVVSAAVIAELMRRLNHATRHATAVPHPEYVASVAGNIGQAMRATDQLSRQLSRRLEDQAASEPMYTTQNRPLNEVIGHTADNLHDVGYYARQVAEALESVQRNADSLGIDCKDPWHSSRDMPTEPCPACGDLP